MKTNSLNQAETLFMHMAPTELFYAMQMASDRLIHLDEGRSGELLIDMFNSIRDTYEEVYNHPMKF